MIRLIRCSTTLAALLVVGVPAAAQEPAAEREIVEAVSPLPEPMRAGAAVLRHATGGQMEVVREGTNEMICLADDPAAEGFHVACYHQSLEPFMARGRALRAEGKDRAAVQAAREAEIAAGELAMPDHPAALYSLSGGSGLDPETGTVTGANPLYVVYIPYATAESSGLSTEAVRGQPWLMAPGKPWAHIMMMR